MTNIPMVSPQIISIKTPRMTIPIPQSSKSNDFDIRNLQFMKNTGDGALFESTCDQQQNSQRGITESNTQQQPESGNRIIRPINTLKSTKANLLLQPLLIEVIDEGSKTSQNINIGNQNDSFTKIPMISNQIDPSLNSLHTEVISQSEISPDNPIIKTRGVCETQPINMNSIEAMNQIKQLKQRVPHTIVDQEMSGKHLTVNYNRQVAMRRDLSSQRIGIKINPNIDSAQMVSGERQRSSRTFQRFDDQNLSQSKHQQQNSSYQREKYSFYDPILQLSSALMNEKQRRRRRGAPNARKDSTNLEIQEENKASQNRNIAQGREKVGEGIKINTSETFMNQEDILANAQRHELLLQALFLKRGRTRNIEFQEKRKSHIISDGSGKNPLSNGLRNQKTFQINRADNYLQYSITDIKVPPGDDQNMLIRGNVYAGTESNELQQPNKTLEGTSLQRVAITKNVGGYTAGTSGLASKLNQINHSNRMQSSLQINQYHSFRALAAHAHHKIKTLEDKIEQIQAQNTKKVEQLEIKLKNTKIFLNMVIHDMRNPTTSIEFAVKEVIKQLSKLTDPRQIMIKGQSFLGLNMTSPPIFGDIGMGMQELGLDGGNPFSQRILHFTKELASNQLGFSNGGYSNNSANNLKNSLRVETQNFNKPKLQQAEDAEDNQLGIDDYKNHKSSSSSSSSSENDKYIQQKEERLGPKSQDLRVDDSDDDKEGKSSMSEESEDFHKAPSMQDQPRGVPCLNTTQASQSPLLFDIKAHQGRTLISLQQQELSPVPIKNQVVTSQGQQNISGNVSGTELRSVLSKGNQQGQSKRKNFQVRIVENEGSGTPEDNSHSVSNLMKMSQDQQDQNAQNQRTPFLPEIKSETPLENDDSSSESLNNDESEEEKKDKEFYQTFGKQHSGEVSHEEEEEQKIETQKDHAVICFQGNGLISAGPDSNPSPTNLAAQQLIDRYAFALKSRQKGTVNNLGAFGQALIKSQSQKMMMMSQKRIGPIMMHDQLISKEDMENLLQTADFSATMLLNLINDLLDLAKMENSSFNLNQTYFNLLEDVISKSVTTLTHMIKEKKITINVSNSKGQDLPEGGEYYLRCVFGDKSRFLQIMLNFLSNALKFTPEGGNVEITTIVKESQDIKVGGGGNSNNGSRENSCNRSIKKLKNEFEMMTAKRCLTPRATYSNNLAFDHKTSLNGVSGKAKKYITYEIRIKDSGVGIAKENLSKLFLNFSRLEDHQKSNERGTGLGLSICKSLLEKMGGNVTVESEGIGFGTTFIIQMHAKCKVLPIQAVQSPDEKFAAKNLLGCKRFMRSQINFRAYSPNVTQPVARKTSLTSKMASELTDNKKIKQNSTIQIPRDSWTFDLVQINKKCQQETPDEPHSKTINYENPILQGNENSNSQLIDNTPATKSLQQLINLRNVQLNELHKFKKSTKTPKQLIKHEEQLVHRKKDMKNFNYLQSACHKLNEDLNQSQRAGSVASLGLLGAFASAQQHRYKVLVANDDSFQLMILNRVLGTFEQYFSVIDQAENGMVAANKAIQRQGNNNNEKQQEPPIEYDIILLDLDMPIMNGFDACKQIRDAQNNKNQGIHALLQLDCTNKELNHSGRTHFNKDDAQKRSPLIIALTAYLNQDIIEKCKQAGFDDWIESPLTKDKIQERLVDKIMDMRGHKPQEEDEDQLGSQVGDHMYLEEEEYHYPEGVEVDSFAEDDEIYGLEDAGEDYSYSKQKQYYVSKQMESANFLPLKNVKEEFEREIPPNY